MTTIGHNVIGASIGLFAFELADQQLSVEFLVLAFFVGIISHYFADFIPHGHYKDIGTRSKDGTLKQIDKKTVTMISLDAVPSFMAVILTPYIIAGNTTPSLFALVVVIGSQLPDIIELLIDLNLVKKGKYLSSHRSFHMMRIHWHSPEPAVGRPWSWTDIWQLIPLLILVFQLSAL